MFRTLLMMAAATLLHAQPAFSHDYDDEEYERGEYAVEVGNGDYESLDLEQQHFERQRDHDLQRLDSFRERDQNKD